MNDEIIKKVLLYRKKGKTYREIAHILKEKGIEIDFKQVKQICNNPPSVKKLNIDDIPIEELYILNKRGMSLLKLCTYVFIKYHVDVCPNVIGKRINLYEQELLSNQSLQSLDKLLSEQEEKKHQSQELLSSTINTESTLSSQKRSKINEIF